MSPADMADVRDLMDGDQTRHAPLDEAGQQAKMREIVSGVPEGADPHLRSFVGLYDMNDKLVGATDILGGYPDADSAYVRLFLTDGGFLPSDGEERLVSDIRDAMAAKGYERVVVDVSSEGEKELRFWKVLGFHADNEPLVAGKYLVREL